MGATLMAAAPVTMAPADDKPGEPVGAAARAKLGPAPLARPASDVGMAEDPPGTTHADPPGLPPAPSAPQAGVTPR